MNEVTFFIGGLILGGTAGILIGGYIGDDCMRNEAVKKGHASWVPDEDGEPQFTWNEKQP